MISVSLNSKEQDVVDFSIFFGECIDCLDKIDKLYDESGENMESKIIKSEQKNIENNECIMEVYECPLCKRVFAALGINGYGILSFDQSYEGEEFVFEELYDIFMSEFKKGNKL